MRVISVVTAIASGILVLLGYFFEPLGPLQTLLLNWAIILAGMAAIVGVFNLISVHGDKIRRREKGTFYSAILMIALVGTFIFGALLGPAHVSMRVLVNGIIMPAEAMLMGLLTITLLYAAIRLLRRRVDLMSIVFLIVAVLVMLGSATLPFGNVPIFSPLRTWLSEAWAVGGARGILIGVALGTITTGLRVLFGADRPYGGN